MATLKYTRLIIEFRPNGDAAWFEGMGLSGVITDSRIERAMHNAVNALRRLRVEAERESRAQQRKLEATKSDDKGVKDAAS